MLAGRGAPVRFEEYALTELARLGYNSQDSPCFLQAFELSSLEWVQNRTELPLVFLLEQNITNEVWDRIDLLGVAGIGVDKVG